MGLKGFIWVILLGIVVILVLQNLQPISLIFFGSKSIYLPISIWVILFIGAGIFSSLIIQGLSNFNKVNSSPVNSPRESSSYSSNIPPSPPSPSSPPNSPNKKNVQFDEESPVNPSYQEDFEDFPEPLKEDNAIDNNKQDLVQEKPTNIDEIPNDKSNLNLNKDSFLEAEEMNDNIDNKEETTNKEEKKTNVPRKASLYSYQPKERTKIRPIVKPQNKIYDADYRVITPPHKNINSSKNQDEDDDNENWDF